jgi:hypothetical protein
VSEKTAVADEATMQFGLLMESARAHQQTAELSLGRLDAHTQGLDQVIRDVIGRTLIEELRHVTIEGEEACRALKKLQRTANLRSLWWSVCLAVLSTVVPLALTRFTLPSASTLAALEARRDLLSRNIAALEQHGGRIDWRRCGADGRLCVRIDKQAAVYGESADYLIVKGY